MVDEQDTKLDPLKSPDDDATIVSDRPSITGFAIKNVLGEGGMARVYLANDLQLDRPVAIKVMGAEISNDDEFRLRFDDEGKTVAQFRHQNIVAVHTSGEVDGMKYIVMEYAAGGTLTSKLDGGSVNVQVAVRIAHDMADALAYSHARGIVHRDFKPGNILFTEDGVPVLSDFGVARSSSPNRSAKTQLGIIIGAPRYMAPEQAFGEVVTDKADVYSFGIVLYEMLTGDVPPKNSRMISKPADETPIRKILRREPSSVVTLLCRCLQAEPAARPTAMQCRDTLAAVELSEHSGLMSRLGRRSHRPIVALGVAGLSTAVAVVWIYIDSTDAPSDARSPVVSEPQAVETPNTTEQTVLHTFTVNPPETQLYVDGVPLEQLNPVLRTGVHTVVAVASNYVGKVLQIQVDSEPSDTTVSLEPLTLPTAAEHVRFLTAADASTLSTNDIAGVSDHSLRTALDLRRMALAATWNEMDMLYGQLAALASYRDPASALILYLAGETDELRSYLSAKGIVSADLLPGLETASEDGYGLATFWNAVRLRGALLDKELNPNDEQFLRYCETLELAVAQGMAEIALPIWSTDECQRL